MTNLRNHILKWNGLNLAWKEEGQSKFHNNSFSTLLIHGFGANKEHWRHNQKILGQITPCYSIDLIGFGESSQPNSRKLYETQTPSNFYYCFNNWANQINYFSRLIIKKPVLLIGNSIGGVIALQAAKMLGKDCKGIILINCAQRLMDDKQLGEHAYVQKSIRPLLKYLTQNKWITKNLFKNAANPNFIKKVLKKAYPSGSNIDEELINSLFKPTQRLGAAEAFHGFINIFDDHLAPNLMKDLSVPVDMIWGKDDPWEPIDEAKNWLSSINCIRSLEIIDNSGHCPHDETPEKVNPILTKIIQQAT